MRRKTRPCVQELEDRCVPVTWGNPWPDATHLTLSFAPDGTKLGSQTSELFSKLDATMPRDAWQMEILRAFQTWAAQSNINVGLVSDGGQAFGTPGSVQSDTRFGDVRLSGVPLADDALATTIPFEVAGGTLAGDVRVNTDSPFTPGGVGGFDLNTVMMQEAGHVFGLDNSPDPNSVMYEIYSGKRAGLSAGDVAALQALYGARKPDALEGGGGNETRSTATRLNLLSNSDGSLSFSAAGDITTAAERDVYSFTTPLSAGTLVVRLRTSGLSLLTSQVSVFDAWSNRLKTAAAVDPRSGDLLLLLNGLRILSTYNVQVEGAGTEVFRVGSYQLDVQWLPLVNGLVGTATGLVGSATGTVTQLLANNDLHTNDGINAAGLSLQQTLAKTDSPLDYAFRASIGDSSDVDFYKVTAPATSSALTVMAWGKPWQPGQYLAPAVRVFDSGGNPVRAEVLVNDGYTFTVQVADATPGASYYVEVLALDPVGAHNVGNYFLGVDFRPQAVALQTYGQGQLAAAQPKATTSFSVDMSSEFHFVLSANTSGAAGVRVLMTIFDEAGNAVYSLGATAGMPVSGNVYLKRGTYTVRYLAGTLDGSPLPDVTFNLKGLRTSDNNGPQPVDPTSSPSGSSSTSSGSTSNNNPGSSGVSSQPSYSDPYSTQEQQDWFYYWDASNSSSGSSSSSSDSSTYYS